MTLRAEFDSIQKRALLVGVAASAAAPVGAFSDPLQFFRS